MGQAQGRRVFTLDDGSDPGREWQLGLARRGWKARVAVVTVLHQFEKPIVFVKILTGPTSGIHDVRDS
jgi:hypothetical protein